MPSPGFSGATDLQRHFARELHDELAQPLIELLLEIREVRARHIESADLTADLLRLEESTRRVLRQAREMMLDLRERTDLRLDLPSALANELPAPAGGNLNLQVTTRWPRQINGWAAFNLLRIIQQAVANAWRHGKAGRVDVVLDVGTADDGVVVVLDDGVGIDDAPRGFGMTGMQERAAILGGSFSAEARESGGTRIEVRFPLARLT